ncbi:hypothetical protein C0J52_11381 [Blattella germanica]|nr:hypothetical protein C0J52_11381 [Blattella germanica]
MASVSPSVESRLCNRNKETALIRMRDKCREEKAKKEQAAQKATVTQQNNSVTDQNNSEIEDSSSETDSISSDEENILDRNKTEVVMPWETSNSQQKVQRITPLIVELDSQNDNQCPEFISDGSNAPEANSIDSSENQNIIEHADAQNSILIKPVVANQISEDGECDYEKSNADFDSEITYQDVNTINLESQSLAIIEEIARPLIVELDNQNNNQNPEIHSNELGVQERENINNVEIDSQNPKLLIHDNITNNQITKDIEHTFGDLNSEFDLRVNNDLNSKIIEPVLQNSVIQNQSLKSMECDEANRELEINVQTPNIIEIDSQSLYIKELDSITNDQVQNENTSGYMTVDAEFDSKTTDSNQNTQVVEVDSPNLIFIETDTEMNNMNEEEKVEYGSNNSSQHRKIIGINPQDPVNLQLDTDTIKENSNVEFDSNLIAKNNNSKVIEIDPQNLNQDTTSAMEISKDIESDKLNSNVKIECNIGNQNAQTIELGFQSLTLEEYDYGIRTEDLKFDEAGNQSISNVENSNQNNQSDTVHDFNSPKILKIDYGTTESLEVTNAVFQELNSQDINMSSHTEEMNNPNVLASECETNNNQNLKIIEIDSTTNNENPDLISHQAHSSIADLHMKINDSERLESSHIKSDIDNKNPEVNEADALITELKCKINELTTKILKNAIQPNPEHDSSTNMKPMELDSTNIKNCKFQSDENLIYLNNETQTRQQQSLFNELPFCFTEDDNTGIDSQTKCYQSSRGINCTLQASTRTVSEY